MCTHHYLKACKNSHDCSFFSKVDWRVKGNLLRGKEFSVSENGNCPRCQSNVIVFVILDEYVHNFVIMSILDKHYHFLFVQIAFMVIANCNLATLLIFQSL